MLVDILGVVVAAVAVSGSLMESWRLPHTNLESSHTSRLLLANIVFNQCLIINLKLKVVRLVVDMQHLLYVYFATMCVVDNEQFYNVHMPSPPHNTP